MNNIAAIIVGKMARFRAPFAPSLPALNLVSSALRFPRLIRKKCAANDDDGLHER